MPFARLPLALAAALVGATGAGCAGGGSEGGSASCALVVEYDGHRYLGQGELRRDPELTGRTMAAVLPACNDTGDNGVMASEPDEPISVQELAGVPADTAVLWQDSVLVRDGRTLPARTRTWFTAPKCDTDGRFELTGDWLGVTGPKEPRFDGDLRVPYRLRVHVTSGPPTYVGATIQVHATEDTTPLLGPSDVKQSLWKGGRVTASVRCADDRFEALGLHT